MSEADHIAAHRCASRHRSEIEKSALCGCFYCGETFENNRIQQWTDAGQTALCPHCGIDAVIGNASGYPLTPQFLGEMKRYWFGKEPDDFA